MKKQIASYTGTAQHLNWLLNLLDEKDYSDLLYEEYRDRIDEEFRNWQIEGLINNEINQEDLTLEQEEEMIQEARELFQLEN